MVSKQSTTYQRSCATRGFTLYYAVLFGGVILMIGTSLASVALKEFLLSATARESEYSFYAADAGTECALYWDLKGLTRTVDASGYSVGFPNVQLDGNGTIYETGVTPRMKCDNKTVTMGWPSSYSPTICTGGCPAVRASGNAATTTFFYTVGTDRCAFIDLGKQKQSNGYITTTLDVRGYNFACGVSNIRKVEREIITQY